MAPLTRRMTLGAPMLLAAGTGRAQGRYPDRPVRLVVPYAAGTAADVLTRQVAQPLSELLGQPVVVDNRAGAGGIVGAEHVARATPDGYTILSTGNTTQAINVSLYRSLPYDPLRDFTPVARVATQPMILVVNATVPARDLRELVALARTRPGAMNYASTGAGTPAHLGGELLRSLAAIDIVHVPYNGGQVFTDLIAGTTAMMFSPYPLLKGFVEKGQLRAIAICAPERATWLPGVPTTAEQGMPGLLMAAWYGAYGPARLPTPILQTLTEVYRQTLSRQTIIDAFRQSGTEPFYAPPEELGQFTTTEIERYRPIIEASGARVG